MDKEKKAFLQGLKIEFVDHNNNPIKLEGYDTILKFFEEQHHFWQTILDESGGNLVKFCATQLNHCLTQLEQFNPNGNQPVNSLAANWSDVTHQISQYLKPRRGPDRVIFVEGGLKPFIESFNKNTNEREGALRYLMGYPLTMTPQNNLSKEMFNGYLKAYEYEHQASSKIVSRAKFEQKGFESLFKKWTALLETSVSDYDAFKDQFETWRGDFQKEQKDWLEKHQNEVENLENAYGELLQLAKPAEYWRERAKTFRTRNKWWLAFASLVTVGLLAILIVVLYSPPEAFSHSLFNGDPLAIKGLVLFVAIISFGGYLLHLFVKLSTSSLHLARDAEEREQLTHVFLALLKNEAITPDDRNIVLQALFSRADTGLLKDDGGPTMPGLTQILGKMVNR